MKIEVLGCDGGPGPGARLSCYLVDERLLIDCGCVVSSLPRERLDRIECVIITHCHFDHILELPFLPMMRDVERAGPLAIVAAPPAIDRIRRFIFNPEIWFDLSPQGRGASFAGRIEYRPVPAGETFECGGVQCELVPVAHEGDTHGVIAVASGSGFAFTSDTGPTDEIWWRLRDHPKVRDVLADCSYPNDMEEMAIATGHLTPRLLAAEATKLPTFAPCCIHAVHIKPEWRAQTLADIAAIAEPQITAVTSGDVLTI